MRQLWDQREPQLSTAKIGVELGKTKNSVVGMAHRLGLEARPSPIKRPGSPDYKGPRVRLSKRGAKKTLPQVEAPAPEPPAPRGPVKPCRFLIKTGREAGGMPIYCDEPTRPLPEGGGPYCRAHAALCYTSESPVARRRMANLSGVSSRALAARVVPHPDDGDPQPLTGEAA